MKNKKLRILLISLAVVLAAGAAVYAAGGYGSQDDPLITKSYLDYVLRPQLEEEMRQQLTDVAAEAARARGEFVPVALNPNKRLFCSVGTELLLRSGTATSLPDWGTQVLTDTTTGETAAGGAALAENHLYIVSAAEGGILAGSYGATLLICGAYTLEEPPVETEPPEETEIPAETETPEETEAPAETEAPEGTEAPAETEAPEGTEAPAETEAPEGTEAPAETEAPEGTEAPAETEAPEGTEAPAETEAPEETEVSAETEAPAESENTPE